MAKALKLYDSSTIVGTYYLCTPTLTNLTITWGDYGEELLLAGVVNTFTLVAASGYTLPATITMTKAGSPYTGFTYDSSTGAVSLPSADITDSFNIEANAASTGYTVHVVPRAGRIAGYGDVYYKANDESYVMWTGGEVTLSGITKMQFKAVGTDSMYNAAVRQADSYPNISSYTTVLSHSGIGTTESSILQISAEAYFDIISGI